MADKQTVKVGDRVKSLVTQLDVREEATYEVKTVDFDGTIWVTDDVGDRFHLTTDEFELLPNAPATGKPSFKVGDRVRVLSDYLPWASADEIGVVQAVNARDRDCYVKFETERMGDHTWYVRWDNLEIAPLLTIETGKFYRTRDGHKVGPIGWNDTYLKDPFPFVDTNDISDCWSAEGKFLYPGHPDSDKDIIAGWVDEPLATASTDAASNGNVPVAKFKIGDIVKRSGSFMPHQRLRITKAVGDRYSVEWLEGGPGSIDNWRGYELELVGPTSKPAIVALIENGQPKPSEKPKVHKSEESATDEAERLAVKYPGQKFGVFVLADSRIADVVIRRAA
ncbi:hypothetical protein F9K96_06935 [Brucella anthropi]|uniref:hypothetical protein n=1 Tax=Brucella anthropi TaxID=529 RepID=UPI00124C10D7|nr:hypothetical protein [Brucella anthropi]KAB2792856.1 hypothetical protein F9K96_06935 [Brucella anthropi]